jgi:hypothetical protein
MSPKRLRQIAPFDECPGKRFCTLSDSSHAEKVYPCDQCDLSYKNSPSLGRHKKLKHGKAARFYCESCGGSFQRPEGVSNHIERNRCPASGSEHAHRKTPLHSEHSTAASTLMKSSPITSHDEFPAALTPTMQKSSISPVTNYANAKAWLAHLQRATADLLALEMLRPNRLDFSECSILRAHRKLREESQQPQHHSLRLRIPELYKIKIMPANETLKLWRKTEPDQPWCTKRCPSPRSPFPPAFEFPTSQDLEDLILRRSRFKRRLDVMNSFHDMHRKFRQHSIKTECSPQEGCDSRATLHLSDSKQAWRDSVSAARQLLSGTLPRELHSVLGIAQIASAVRSAIEDVDAPAASEERFLFDLGRWRQLLPSNSYAAFDYFADILWDNRPPSDLAWKDTYEMDTLVYFQGLLADMLLHIEYTPLKEVELESTIFPSGAASHSGIAEDPVSTSLVPDILPSEVEDPRVISLQDEPKHTTLMELVLYSAGAIFALILMYILRKSPPSTPHKSVLTP